MDEPLMQSHVAREILRKALAEQMIELLDSPAIGMLGDVKVRFTPSGAVHLAELIGSKSVAKAIQVAKEEI